MKMKFLDMVLVTDFQLKIFLIISQHQLPLNMKKVCHKF